ncbi:hypothetical protein RDI58_029366 [Solanum bulbocastanum]|uniref:Uncharacterized protein n=1 Tax=Solanum bulbocastanum TaxID=147425 RepID=A0AAN8SU52_SOLBU
MSQMPIGSSRVSRHFCLQVWRMWHNSLGTLKFLLANRSNMSNQATTKVRDYAFKTRRKDLKIATLFESYKVVVGRIL